MEPVAHRSPPDPLALRGLLGAGFARSVGGVCYQPRPQAEGALLSRYFRKSVLWRPGSAPGSRLPPAAAARSQTAVATTRGSCASTVSRPASCSPGVGQREQAYLRLRTAGVADRYTVTPL